MAYQKRPSKQELYKRIDALERINADLVANQEKEMQKIWNERVPRAIEKINEVLKPLFGTALKNLSYIRVDASGYWFTFELTNDSRRQTYCVRHNEI
jgi:hypothetical protein